MSQTLSDNAFTLENDGDRRIDNFASRWAMLFGVLFTTTMAGAILVFAVTIASFPSEDGCKEVAVDFCVFWSAAKLAIEGQVLSVFNLEALIDSGTIEGANWSPWLHPASTLLVIYPLGAMTLQVAWATFAGISLLAVFLALRPFTWRQLPIWTGFAMAPALMPPLLLGQFTLLWIAGLLSALWSLREGNKLLAGLIIGLLTLKPTLGILIPIALLAHREWKVIFVATATTVVLNLTASLIFGFDYWVELWRVYGDHKDFLVQELHDLEPMGSVAALLARVGLPPSAALLTQSLLLLVLIGAVYWLWSKPDVNFDRKAALLAAAIPLSTPYLWQYDAALVMVAGLFLLRSGQLSAKPVDLILLIILCFGPGLRTWYSLLTPWSAPAAAWFCVPIMILALLLCLRPAPGTPLHPLERTQ